MLTQFIARFQPSVARRYCYRIKLLSAAAHDLRSKLIEITRVFNTLYTTNTRAQTLIRKLIICIVRADTGAFRLKSRHVIFLFCLTCTHVAAVATLLINNKNKKNKYFQRRNIMLYA